MASPKTSVVDINTPAYKRIKAEFGKYSSQLLENHHGLDFVLMNIINNEFLLSTGEEILLPNGEINRIALGQLVFNDVEKRQLLNYITHPPIHQTIYKQIIKCFLLGHNFVVLDLPLLFETGRFLPYIHKIITVTW